jgi:cytochrome c oxidase assembly factor CtaG
MANWVVALLLALAVSVWIYEKLMNKTGNNRQNSIIVAAVTAVLLFIILYFVLGIIF